MKLERWVRCLWGFVLGLGMSMASVACLVTAFDMAVSLWTVWVWCVLSSAVCSLCFTLPLKLLPPCAGALLGGYLWQNGSLELSVEALLYRLSRQYDRAYHWGLIRWNLRTADDMEPTLILILCVLGALIAMLTAWAVCRRRSALPGVLLSLLSLGACLVVTDTVPDVGWLYLLLLGLVVLLLTGRARSNIPKADRLYALVTPAAALALLILFAAVPQQGYTGQKYADAIVNADSVGEFFLQLTGEAGTRITDSDGVDLTTVGNRLESDAVIMEVSANYTDTLYLRSRAMDTYDGKSWSSSGATDLAWPTVSSEPAGEVTITTRYAHRMLYLPYYVKDPKLGQMDLGVENQEKLTRYTLSCRRVPSQSDLERAYGQAAGGVFGHIFLSDAVLRWATPLAEEIGGQNGSVYEKARRIADYVRQSAAYDKNTPRMPGGEDDFVRWFLSSSDTGYCIHFASAATVLLQAAGIPARYVTGYTAEAVEGQVVQVRAKDAHAWTEYWLPGFGWTVLEATPGDLGEGIQDTTRETVHQGETRQTDPQVPEQTPLHSQDDAPGLLWLLWLAGALAAVAAMEGQRCLRLQAARKLARRGTANARALAGWRQTVRLSRLLGETPDKGLYELAQKAKFSQYTLTPEELDRFDSYARQARERLKQHPLPHRLYYRYILAIC